MEDIIIKLKTIWDGEENIMKAGGTYASWQLRKCLQLVQELETYTDHPKYSKIKGMLQEMIVLYQKALHRHNSQSRKFIEYDLTTGMPLNGSTPMEPIKLKPPRKSD